MRFSVYKQADPIPTGEPIPAYQGRSSGQVWHRANLVKLGEADTMEQAKQLCTAPVLEPRD